MRKSGFKHRLWMVIYKIKRNKAIKAMCGLLNFVVAISTLVFMVLAFFSITNTNEFRLRVRDSWKSQKAIDIWKEDLADIRIGCSRQFVESVIGNPQMVENISINEYSFLKCVYLNSYFSLFCIYEGDAKLIGLLVIGNDRGFDLKNYRCGFSLFDYTINGAVTYCDNAGVVSVVLNKMNFSNRLDSNAYYFECRLQHSNGATPPYYIGYGVCDIGAMESHEYDIIHLKHNNVVSIEHSYQNETNYDNKSFEGQIRDIPINSFLIMGGLSEEVIKDGTIGFLDSYLICHGALGMSRDDYYNFQDDYESCFNEYMEKENSIE